MEKCGNYPRFDPSDSTSFKSLNQSFSVLGRSGKWSTDNILLGNITLAQVEMGVVTSEETTQPPTFGIGRPSVGQSPHKDGPVNRLSGSTSRVGITLTPQVAEITLGGESPKTPPIPPAAVDLEDDTHTYQLYQGSKDWSLILTGLGTIEEYQEVHPTNNKNTTGLPASIATAESVLGLPDQYYFNLVPSLIGNLRSCNYNTSVNQYRCNRHQDCSWLPDIKIGLVSQDGSEISHILKSSDYTKSTSTGCQLSITRTSHFVLGTPFLSRYFTILDLHSETVSLTSLKRIYPKDGKDVEAEVIWWISVSGLCAWFLYFIYERCCQTNKTSILDTSSSDDAIVDIASVTDNRDPKTGNYSEL